MLIITLLISLLTDKLYKSWPPLNRNNYYGNLECVLKNILDLARPNKNFITLASTPSDDAILSYLTIWKYALTCFHYEEHFFTILYLNLLYLK